MTTKISDESVSTMASTSSASSSSSSTSNNVASYATDTKSTAVGVNRKSIIIDETLLPPDEAEKVLARRAYNRDCAARARKRCKQNVVHLEKQVKELQEDKEALRRSLVTMGKQIAELESQNKVMKLKQMIEKNRIDDAFMVDPLELGSAIGSGLPASSMFQMAHQQQQLRQMRQQAAMGGTGASSVDMAQFSRYMNMQNRYI